MPILHDGTVSPMSMTSSGEVNPVYEAQYQNTALRVGYITKRYKPADAMNRNKKVWEYDVVVAHRRGRGSTSYSTYYRCVTTDTFGEQKNLGEVVLSADTEVDKFGQPSKFGTAVLLMCVNGASDFPVIIGHLRHPKLGAVEGEVHELRSFNGLSSHIDKEGTFTFTHAGLEEKYQNVLIMSAKDGTTIFTNTDGDQIKVDAGELTVDFGSSAAFTIPSVIYDTTSFQIGTSLPQPVMRADPQYISTLQNVLNTLTATLAALAATMAALATEALVPKAAAAAAGAAGPIAAATAALGAHLATLTKGVAISNATTTD